jgi:drug/metabolite transporter (DMT)-like permease
MGLVAFASHHVPLLAEDCAVKVESRRVGTSARLAIGLLVVLVTSLCFVVIRTSLTVSPFLYSGLRAILAGSVLLVIAAAAGRVLPPRDAWPWLLLLGAAGTTVVLGGMFLAVDAAGAALPSVLANSQALLVAPAAAILFGEKLDRKRVLALLVGWGGVVLMVSASSSRPGDWAGASLGLAAALGAAVATLLMKRIGRSVDPVTAAGWQFIMGGVPLLVASFLLERPNEMAWSPTAVVGLLFLAIVGSAGASWAWFWLVRDGELISLSALTLLTPAFALVLATVLLGERPERAQTLGAVLIMAGAAWAAWPRRT